MSIISQQLSHGAEQEVRMHVSANKTMAMAACGAADIINKCLVENCNYQGGQIIENIDTNPRSDTSMCYKGMTNVTNTITLATSSSSASVTYSTPAQLLDQ